MFSATTTFVGCVLIHGVTIAIELGDIFLVIVTSPNEGQVVGFKKFEIIWYVKL